MVIWLIGMSASGKTTIGKKLYDKLSLSDEKWIFIDGDTFRNILNEDLGHTIEDRRRNAYRISRFCEFLSSQGVNVLACVLSIFHENQKYNKEHIQDYKEVYIDVDFNNLLKRDNKQLYKKALNNEIKDVVGVDIDFKPPYSPDLVIDNNPDNPNYDDMIQNIINTFNISVNNGYSYTARNLLENPHTYQYSKFEGESFFDTFKNDRLKTLHFLMQRLQKLVNTNFDVYSIGSDEYIKNNDLVLKFFLIHIINIDDNKLDEHKNKVIQLIKRFEVGKKLYVTYDLKEIKKSSADFKELLNYPLFSLVLQKYYKHTQSQEKLVYLNAILKVNDIISSIKSDLISVNEVGTSIEALNGELNIIGELV